MNHYLHNLFVYFENVLHPAGGWSDNASKKKRTGSKNNSMQASPECFNLRGGIVKQNKLRRSPAP